MADSTASAAPPVPSALNRAALIGAALAIVVAVALVAGVRFGLLVAVGLGFGITLEGLRFGFAGPWRAAILRREPAGVIAQLVAIGLVAIVALPLIAANSDALVGARAPVGFAMVGGAFIFGAAMQIVLGCGSGTLVNSGSGNPISLLALPFFIIGSFAGSYHLVWWTNLGTAPLVVFSGVTGVVITLLALAAVGAVFWFRAPPEARTIPRRLWIAAGLLAAFAIANLIIAGQPWGVVYGLGLWGAKAAAGLGVDMSGSAFWSAPGNMERLQSSILTDVTSLTNIGIIVGAFLVAAWRSGGLAQPLPTLPAKAWVATVIAGFLLGYSSRIAFGCNVGAFFSGISTGSLHGWVWFVAAFAGAHLGIKIRPSLGLEAR